MSKFDPNKLLVEFNDGVTPTNPIIPRRYTLTHSDITAELFLNIGKSYDYNSITIMRDEVLGEWILLNEKYFYLVNLHVDAPTGLPGTAIRNEIFIRELPLALQAIRYGDKELFNTNLILDLSPILVYFNSKDPKYNRVENYGTFSQYMFQGSSRNCEPTSFIKISNSSSNTPELDIYINGILELENLPYRNSTEVLPYPPGNYTIDIIPKTSSSTATTFCTSCNVIPNHISNIYIIDDNSNLEVYIIPQPTT